MHYCLCRKRKCCSSCCCCCLNWTGVKHSFAKWVKEGRMKEDKSVSYLSYCSFLLTCFTRAHLASNWKWHRGNKKLTWTQNFFSAHKKSSFQRQSICLNLSNNFLYLSVKAEIAMVVVLVVGFLFFFRSLPWVDATGANWVLHKVWSALQWERRRFFLLLNAMSFSFVE